MSKKDIYILMNKNDEVLSFYVDFKKSRAFFIQKLEHFDKAPYGINKNDGEIDTMLNSFFNSRAIPFQRNGYKNILKATHCRNGFVLSFKGHGLSLSNHFWYKKVGEKLRYEDIDSFAKAVIAEDYETLVHVDLNVPDIVTAGWGVKGWLYDEKKGPRLYKLGINKDSPDEVLGEVLASRLAQRLFPKEEVLQYDLEKINGKYASVSSPMIGVDEELITLSNYLPYDFYRLYRERRLNKVAVETFMNKLKENGHSELYDFFIKLTCLKSLCFVNDMHFENISIVKNMITGEIKMAPLYDLGGAFGSGSKAKEFLAHPNKTMFLLIYFLYSNLDPQWDYSWYDKDKLIGFEDEIREVLSKSEFYTPDLIDLIIDVYQKQKSSLNEMASKKQK